MSESVARSGNKTLYAARSVVELLSQCVVFMAFAAMIILGVVKSLMNIFYMPHWLLFL